jgi:nucleoid-associated protein YgaU
LHPDVIVKSGDTLINIAMRYPEPAITAASIAAANVDRHPGLRDDPDHIEVGWSLRIR